MLNDYSAGDFKTLSVVYAIFILAVSFAQIPEGPSVLNIDKLMHASLYYGFAFVLWRGFSDKKVFAVAFFLGVLIEFVQPFFGRSFEIFDMAADGIGILIFYYFFARGRTIY